MKVVLYLVPAIFSGIMLINGAMRYWGSFDKASTEAIFFHYIPSKREEKNWKISQKIYGRNLLIAALLNIVTELALIPVGNRILHGAEQTDSTSMGMVLFMFVPSLVYMFGARIIMEWKLKQLDEQEESS